MVEPFKKVFRYMCPLFEKVFIHILFHYKISSKATMAITVKIFSTQLPTIERVVLHLCLIFCIILEISSVFAATIQNYEESECSLGQSRNYKGVCKRIQNCPSSLSNLHAGLYPVNCLYTGDRPGTRTPLVCCESDPRSRISVKKCAEYEEIAERNEKAGFAPPTFLLPSNIPSEGTKNTTKNTRDRNNDAVESLEFANPAFFVVGGSNARVGQFPYMAALGFSTRNTNISVGGGRTSSLPRISWLCGGTLISDLHVITAAHCLQERRGKGKPSFVLLGDVNLKEDDNAFNSAAVDSRQIIPIQDYVVHPRYNFGTSKQYDIGIIRLKEKAIFSRNVKAACLPQPMDRLEMNNAWLTATGWGLTEFGGSPSETLQFVELKRQTHQSCVDAYSDKITNSSEIIPSQFCAGSGSDDDVPRDTCDGDSGSGLTVKRTTTNNLSPRFVVGITSFGSKYCGLDKPGVYTNVQSFLDWIEEIVWPPNNE